MSYFINGIFKFSLPYWVKRKAGDIVVDVVGCIKFDLACNPLPFNKSHMGTVQAAAKLNLICNNLIKNLADKHDMFDCEILDILSHAMCKYRVDMESIEPDTKRMIRELQSNDKGLTTYK